MVDEAKISNNFLSLLGNLQQRDVGSSSSTSNQRTSAQDKAKGNHPNTETIESSESLLKSTKTKVEREQKNTDIKRKPPKNQTEIESSCRGTTLGGSFLSSLDNFQHSNNVTKPKREYKDGQNVNQRAPKGFHRGRSVECEGDTSNRSQGSRGIGRNKASADHTNRQRVENHVNSGRGRSETATSNNPPSKESNADSRKELNTNTYKQKSGGKPIRMMGHRFLESLLDCENSHIVTTLAGPRSGFKEFLNNRPLGNDLLILIIRVLNKVNHSEIDQLKMHILSEAFSPEFFDEIKRFCAMTCIEDSTSQRKLIDEFFPDILSLFESVINMFPSMMNEQMRSVMVALNLLMKHAKDEKCINVQDFYFEKWKTINDQIHSCLEAKQIIERDQNKNEKTFIKSPNNFRELPLVPTIYDFIHEKAFLRRNITKGSFENVEHYLDTQFRLLREDFISPLRTGIYEYISSLNSLHHKKKYSNVRINSKVQFTANCKSRDTYGFLVAFDCEKKLPRNINWEYNKRFMVGSLLLFTDDAFQTFYLATVGSREVEQLKEGLIFVAFVPGTEIPSSIFDPGKYFTMAESEVYYEAYCHVLAALKRMKEDNFPMKRYIVDVHTAVSPPQYVQDESLYTVSGYTFDLFDEYSWPSPQQLKLNPSQFKAFKNALTNDFVVIQGPPGTGKTFLALKIAEVLLKNKVSKNTPIVVICYTNHALDQFLEGILKITERIIRIGSQSQNEALQDYNIGKLRQQKKGMYSKSDLYWDTIKEKKKLEEKIGHVEKKIEELTFPEGILNLEVLRSVIPPQHYYELDNYVLDWLLFSDNPEFFNQVANQENQTQTANVASGEPFDVFHNASEFQEEFFEEQDDDEYSKRLADMVEDDFFENDFTIEANYISDVSYSLKIRRLETEISDLNYRLETISEQSKEYFTILNIIHIKTLQINFILLQFSKLEDLVFDPVKLYMFQQVNSVWEMSGQDRWVYYMTLVHLYCSQLKQIIQNLTDRYRTVLSKLNELNQLEDLAFVQQAAVIGLTTSGAAKRRILLENLRTKIVIVEEAAEVLEAHIVTSLTKSVQHVILIGDHKQLKPSPAVFELAKKYGLDVSLFERMLTNGLGCHMLDVQHRMRPEISKLVKPIYPTLMDHPSTFDRPKVTGIDKYVFFLTHNVPEDQIPDSSSRQNKYEANFLLALCQHLMLQGYDAEEITILATYTGQVWYMRKEKRMLSLSNPDWRRVRITSVDNFQGEENRIILLTLVRSNRADSQYKSIGFLSTENRVCVALSRAKEGLYIVGNMDDLSAYSVIWPKIKEQLDELSAVGQKLTLRCARHPDRITQVSHAKDFNSLTEGGCSQICDDELSCGHNCPRKCHIIDQYHAFHQCMEPCTRILCEFKGHKCPLLCKDTCQPCKIPVERQLACGHSLKLACHIEPASVNCRAPVLVTLPKCSHEVYKSCYKDIDSVSCTSKCETRLLCGHSCIRKCHVEDDPNHEDVKCMKSCIRKNETCRSNHPCQKPCYEPCGNCITLVKTILMCGHQEEIACSMDQSTFQCKKKCKRTLQCGHPCPLACWLPCESAQCVIKVDKVCAYGHKLASMRCCDPPETRNCTQSCNRTLTCGHPCTARCYVDCSKIHCEEEVKSSVAPACGHPAPNIPCRINKTDLMPGSDELVQLCKEPCGKVRICGHLCKGSCGNCMQGRLHVPCEEQCDKLLICGHRCKSKCSELCPPCKVKDCINTCFHKNRCSHLCENSCEPCNKPCQWVCVHHRCSKKCGEECNRPQCDKDCPEYLPCGHPCLGFCGEPHPPLCRTCNADNPEIIALSYFGRFVVLEDCKLKHIVDSDDLDYYIMSNVNSQLKCPKCDTPVVKTMRYRSIYIKYREQMMKKLESISKEEFRLRKIHSRNESLFRLDPTNSESMNKMLKECSMPFHGVSHAGYSRLVLSCLLAPLANQCEQLNLTLSTCRLTTVVYQRLKLRLEYLYLALVPRMKRISYPDILQIELEVARILRAVSENLPDLWYNIHEYSWAEDRRIMQRNVLENVSRLSLSLKTRDATKQWSICDHGHLYVSDEGGICDTCKDFAEEEQLRLEQATKKDSEDSTLVNDRFTNHGQGMRFRRGWRGERGRRGGRGRGEGRGRGGGEGGGGGEVRGGGEGRGGDRGEDRVRGEGRDRGRGEGRERGRGRGRGGGRGRRGPPMFFQW